MAKSKVRGVHQVRQGIQQFVNQASEESVQITEEAARKILQTAKDNVRDNAFDTGALWSTGRVATTTKKFGPGQVTTSTVVFGGKPGAGYTDSKNLNRLGEVDYAAAVHELTYPYLLLAIRANESEIKSDMTKQYRVITRKAGRGTKAKSVTPSFER